MGFLNGLKFTGHSGQGWTNEGEKAFYYNQNMARLNPIDGGKKQAYKDDWDVDRAVAEGNDRVTWVYKSVYAIASNAARLPVEIHDVDDNPVDNPLLPILNRKANIHHDAYNFRFQLSSQVLLSKRGAFVEVVKDRLDNVVGLYLLPPNWTFPIPDPKNFVAGYSVQVPNTKERIVKPDDVVWVRIPHPTDPYRGQSPLEACGLAIDIDYYSRIYNRNFMVNDGRPGGILMVQGELDDDAAEEIRRRFLGNTGSALGGAGRMTIMEAEQAKWIDTSMAQRDAQYTETKQLAKEEILMAFGVPESVIGNASERTFANADTELEVFWRETMLPHLMLVERAFDRLDGSEDLTVKFNLEDVAILSRDERERAAFHLEELKFGAISIDEYRYKTGREPVGADLMWIQANLMPIGQAVAQGETPSQEFTPPALSDGQPGVAQPHAPMVTPEVEPSEVVPEAASLNGSSEAKSEDKESAPLERDVWGFEFGGNWIDSKAADDIRARRAQQTARLVDSIALQMVSFFQRQRRVVLEKWNSAKIREKINKGVSVGVNDIMDIPVWDRQLLADAKSFITATVIDGGNEFALMTSKKIEADEELVAMAVVAGLERVTEINRTTRRQIEKKIVKGLGSGKSAVYIADEIKEVFDDAVKNRSRLVANNIVTFGLNEGQMIEASKSGLRYKVWLSQQDEKVRATHTHADGQARPLYEPFSVAGHLMMHPGALTAPVEEVANCRCTMLFTNEPSPAGLLEFGVDPEQMASLTDSSVIARLINTELAPSNV
jgi:HK97 family phage portal protein